MKKKRCALGIDFGTTKAACVLVDLEEGTLLHSASVDTDAYTECKNPLYYEQDTGKVQEGLFEAVTRCMRGFEGEIFSIGVTGQMHGVVGIDERGNPVTNLVTWQDERGNEPGKNGRTLLEEMEERGGKRAIATGYGIVTLYDWIARKRLSDIRKICTIPDYFGMRMTGLKQPVIDDTMAHSTGAFDPWERAWDRGYITALGLDTGVLPDVVLPSTVLGHVRDEDILTLLKGSRPPVSVCIGDNQASFIGSVRDYSDTILVNIGTASQVSYLSDGSLSADGDIIDGSPSIDGDDVVVRPFVDGRRLVSGNSLSGGCSYANKRIIESRSLLVGSGNALRKNETMRKVTQRIFGKNMLVPLYGEEAAIGAAINGAVACGLVKSFSDAGSMIRYR